MNEQTVLIDRDRVCAWRQGDGVSVDGPAKISLQFGRNSDETGFNASFRSKDGVSNDDVIPDNLERQ